MRQRFLVSPRSGSVRVQPRPGDSMVLRFDHGTLRVAMRSSEDEDLVFGGWPDATKRQELELKLETGKNGGPEVSVGVSVEELRIVEFLADLIQYTNPQLRTSIRSRGDGVWILTFSDAEARAPSYPPPPA